MTLETMQRHEAVTLQYELDDFRRQALIRLVAPYVRGRCVLDLRCLSGQLAVALGAGGHAVTGLDGYAPAVDATNARAAAAGLPAPIAYVWDLVELPEPVAGRLFETVICMDVLNHVPDDKVTVRQVAGALEPGGRLLLVVPAFQSLLGGRDRALGHLRRYTRRSIRQLLERHGLRVERMRYWNFTALPLYVAVEKLWRRPLSDRLRYVRSGRMDTGVAHVLTSWCTAVENHLPLPCGLSLFIIARKLATPEIPSSCGPRQ